MSQPLPVGFTQDQEGAFLRCQGLTKRFGSIVAVDGADLSVEQGRTLALLGPSGCGKTTLLRLIAGFEVPDAGRIELGGRLLAAPQTFVPPEKRRVGMVFQDYALFPHLDVESNIAFGLRGGAGRRGRIAELLALVGLDGLGSRMPHELSGGQQQRVALARALAAKPDVVLLDEAFSNLDPALRAKVRTEVRQIIESLGTTAVFVTHDQEEALSLAEQVAVMLDGRILQVGRPEEVYRRPASRRVAQFLGDANFLPGELRDGHVECILGRIPVVSDVQGAVEVMIRPENLVLSGEAGQPSEVVSCDYYGHDQMVTVRLDGGTLVKVRLLPSRDLAPGQRLGLQLKGEVIVFPREA